MKINETGRSMIEMLAVLAIAGILTVGGITGFRVAMQKMNANKIAEAVAEISVEAQTHNTCINLDDLDDIESLKCVEKMIGGRNGQVKITFEDDESCDNIIEYVGNSFGACRWEKDGDDYLFIPGRGKKCTNTGCLDECETYQKDSCLQ